MPTAGPKTDVLLDIAFRFTTLISAGNAPNTKNYMPAKNCVVTTMIAEEADDKQRAHLYSKT
jgi:hypothetical protein